MAIIGMLLASSLSIARIFRVEGVQPSITGICISIKSDRSIREGFHETLQGSFPLPATSTVIPSVSSISRQFLIQIVVFTSRIRFPINSEPVCVCTSGCTVLSLSRNCFNFETRRNETVVW